MKKTSLNTTLPIDIFAAISTSKVRHGVSRCLHCLVCAQHGRVVNGVKVPCEGTETWKHEIKSPVEVNSGRVTDRGEED
jgi:hypothetical protein